MAGGEKSFDLSTLFLLCNKNCVEIKNLTIKEEYDFELTEKSLADPTIIFCEQKNMELFEINLSYKFSAEREALPSSCVLLKNGMNVIFIPLNKDYLDNAESFLKSLCTGEKVSIFRLFGKTDRTVRRLLSESGINLEKCRVVEKDLLCDIYLSQDEAVEGISETEQKIGQLFYNEIFSQSELELKDVVVSLLNMYRQKLDIIEPFTCGEICRQFRDNPTVLYEGLVPISNRALTAEGQMTGFDFQNGGECSVETNTLLCKSRLSVMGADLVLVLTAKEIDGGFQEIVSIADKNGVSSIKTQYKGTREEAIRFSVNWVLFNLVKKLTKKDFENK